MRRSPARQVRAIIRADQIYSPERSSPAFNITRSSIAIYRLIMAGCANSRDQRSVGVYDHGILDSTAQTNERTYARER